MNHSHQSTPTKSRIDELDVVRGFALFGVFFVHFVGLAFYEMPHDALTKEQWMSNLLNQLTVLASDFLFLNKANTLFATLFGISFWIMLDRLEKSGRDFKAIYLRRLFFLFLIGYCNSLFIFPGDVLHEYALLGFVLFMLRNLPTKYMILIGVVLTFFARPIVDYLLSISGLADDNVSQIRNQAILSGDYVNWFKTMALLNLENQLLNGALLSWGLYLFGRFLVGAWVTKHGWLYVLADKKNIIKKLFFILFPIGLLLELAATLLYEGVIKSPDWLKEVAHATGAPILAFSYAIGLILLYQGGKKRLLIKLFAPVGRIALTAYLGHCIIFALLYLPIGFNLLSAIPPFMSAFIAMGTFLFFAFLGNFCISKFGYGPCEYAWRWATYRHYKLTKIA